MMGYVTTDMVDEYDPALMFTIPRLAIVWLVLDEATLSSNNNTTMASNINESISGFCKTIFWGFKV